MTDEQPKDTVTVEPDTAQDPHASFAQPDENAQDRTAEANRAAEADAPTQDEPPAEERKRFEVPVGEVTGGERRGEPDPEDPPARQEPPSDKPVATAVRVDNRTRRSDDDALEGHWVKIVAGEHEGRVGSFEQVAEHDLHTGYPARILVRSRDAQSELLAVDYDKVRPAYPYAGGR